MMPYSQAEKFRFKESNFPTPFVYLLLTNATPFTHLVMKIPLSGGAIIRCTSPPPPLPLSDLLNLTWTA